MDINSEIVGCLNEIDDFIAEHQSKYAKDPEYLILPVEHRQAIRLTIWNRRDKLLWDIGDPVAYSNIKIIKKEDCIIVDSKQ